MTITVLCASMFDPLGHPLFAKKIAEHLNEHCESEEVVIYGIASKSDDQSQKINDVVWVIPIRCSIGGFTLENRRRLTSKFNILGSLYFYMTKILVVTEFYVRVFRSNKGPMVDLELEPLQFAVAQIFCGVKSHYVGVVHSFPKLHKFGWKALYKRVSALILSWLTKKNQRLTLGLMNEEALENAQCYGIPGSQLALVGWGFTPKMNNRDLRSSGDSIRVLSFGVIRSGKRLDEVVDVFLRANDASIEFSIVGKAVDDSIMEINQKIAACPSQTSVTIQDRFVPENEVASLFAAHDVLVISHNEEFQSASGPMFLALETGMPVLCYSKNFVRKLVEESGLGLCYDLDYFDPNHLNSVLERLLALERPDLENHRYSWKNISRRIRDSIDAE